jgi:hypothetical protein
MCSSGSYMEDDLESVYALYDVIHKFADDVTLASWPLHGRHQQTIR